MACSSWPVLEHSVTFSVQMMCLIMCSLGAILFNPLSFGEGFWSFMTKNSEVVGTCWFPLHVPEKFSLFSKNYFRWTLRIACLNHLYELFKGKGSLTLLFPTSFPKTLYNSTHMLSIFNYKLSEAKFGVFILGFIVNKYSSNFSFWHINCTIFQFAHNKIRKAKGKKEPVRHH